MNSRALLLTLPLAHLTPTGLGPWGDGMARLFVQPTDLLLVIGLLLLGVQGSASCTDRLPLLLPLAWLLGGLAGLTLSSELLLALPSMVAVTAIGVLVALGVRLRPLAFLLGSTALALLFGLVAGSALAAHQGALPALLGEAVAIAVLTTVLLMPLAPPHPRWLVIALRVGGSWITATGLLMLGWLVRHPQ